jgi:hypothetical protein
VGYDPRAVSPTHESRARGALRPTEPVVLVTGNYGSGKTEVAVAWALHLAASGERVTIADLDVVNPYFRCREASALMESAGIRVIAPRGELHHAELPIILPEIRGAIERPEGVTILDVGGDEDGARVLSSLVDAFSTYEMIQVVNQRRPFTDTVAGCLRIQAEIEAASRLRVTALVSNAHLMDETDEAVVVDGADFAREVGRARGQPLRFVVVERRLADRVDPGRLGCPALVLDRQMLPPWRRPDKLGSESFRIRV